MPATLRPIRPSAAIRVAYERRLLVLVDEMHKSTLRWVKAAWRANEPEPITVITGLDASPAAALQATFRKLGKRWLKRFDDLAQSMAESMVKQVNGRTQRILMEDLRRAGFTVKFQTTPAMREAMQSIVAENVNLIRSIPERYLTQAETLAMQSVSQGRDLATLTQGIEKQFGVSRRKAADIALDQNNKATSSLRSIREQELGITEGIWRHSGGGKTPRASHKHFSGQKFKLAEGHDFDDGFGKVLPGQAINCRCYWTAVLPF